jgi:hypothetical protein
VEKSYRRVVCYREFLWIRRGTGYRSKGQDLSPVRQYLNILLDMLSSNMHSVSGTVSCQLLSDEVHSSRVGCAYYDPSLAIIYVLEDTNESNHHDLIKMGKQNMDNCIGQPPIDS